MEKTADVVILVETGEEALRLFDRKAKLANGDGIAEGVDELSVEVREFFQGHEGGATGRFGSHGKHLNQLNPSGSGSKEAEG